MLDDFTRQNRVESVNSLKDSIVALKSSHASLEVTSQAFKESITKEKDLFNMVLTMETVPPTQSIDTVKIVSGKGNNISQTQSTVLSKTEDMIVDVDDSVDVEGIMSTEKVSTITSK